MEAIDIDVTVDDLVDRTLVAVEREDDSVCQQ